MVDTSLRVKDLDLCLDDQGDSLAAFDATRSFGNGDYVSPYLAW